MKTTHNELQITRSSRTKQDIDETNLKLWKLTRGKTGN